MTPELRDKDIAVLQAIHDGATTTAEIKQATTLTNREINYSLTEYSLEEFGLVKITRPEGRQWQEINGQKRNIWKPKTVEITDKGIQKLGDLDQETDRYEDIDKRELIENVQDIEDRLNRLENMFKDFRKKVMERI